jgi:hypothetical protein
MRWGRAIVGGFLAEVMLIVVVLPGGVAGSETIVTWSAMIGAPVVSFLAALWVSRRIESRFVAHGAVTGLSATLIYLIPILAAGVTQPAVYWLGHGLKVAGGAAGGLYAARRKTNATSAARVSV